MRNHLTLIWRAVLIICFMRGPPLLDRTHSFHMSTPIQHSFHMSTPIQHGLRFTPSGVIYIIKLIMLIISFLACPQFNHVNYSGLIETWASGYKGWTMSYEGGGSCKMGPTLVEQVSVWYLVPVSSPRKHMMQQSCMLDLAVQILGTVVDGWC